jgi:ferredoxin-NADP reductase
VTAPDTTPPNAPPPPLGWRAATIERIVVQTPTVKSFVLRPRAWRPFLPGQHIDVRLTASDGYAARRSYSITSAPESQGVFELAVERLDHGEVSPYFHEVAAVGDAIEVDGPFTEHFVWRSTTDGAVLLVGGGSGVAPFVSMVRHRATLTDPPPMVLLYSARTWDDVIYRDELLRHAAEQSGLRVVLCLTRDAPRRPGDYGRRIDAAIVTDVLAAMPEPPRLTFVCGANPFVETVTMHLVALGTAPETIRTERYGG